ncbi:hypothetical protein ISS42_01995 [Candidatus Shapirobacteria bacterium]|nr:hypothetical protein [Candidatus Shapirobacteria bacterium]
MLQAHLIEADDLGTRIEGASIGPGQQRKCLKSLSELALAAGVRDQEEDEWNPQEPLVRVFPRAIMGNAFNELVEMIEVDRGVKNEDERQLDTRNV